MFLPDLRSLILGLPGLLFAIVFHEYAHAWVADRLGDPTARIRGRLTLNPMAHLDWLGVLMLWVAHFGWARPVPVDPRYFKNPRRDMVAVALAGPIANFILATLSAWLWVRSSGWPGAAYPGSLVDVLGALFEMSLIYNVALGVFNLIPVPPLDGSRILAGLLPPRLAWRYQQIDAYGWLILLLLLATGAGGRWISPIIGAVASTIRGWFL